MKGIQRDSYVTPETRRRNLYINRIAKIAVFASLILLALSITAAPVSYCVLNRSDLFYAAIGIGSASIGGILITPLAVCLTKRILRKERKLIQDQNEPAQERSSLLYYRGTKEENVIKAFNKCSTCAFSKIYFCKHYAGASDRIFEGDGELKHKRDEVRQNCNAGKKQLLLMYPDSRGATDQAWKNRASIASRMKDYTDHGLIHIYLSFTDMNSIKTEATFPSWLRSIIETGTITEQKLSSGSFVL